MIRGWLQKRRVKREQDRCAHDYKKIGEYEKCVRYSLVEIVVIYCPKCNRDRSVRKSVWKMILKKQKVHKEYYSEEERSENKE